MLMSRRLTLSLLSSVLFVATLDAQSLFGIFSGPSQQTSRRQARRRLQREVIQRGPSSLWPTIKAAADWFAEARGAAPLDSHSRPPGGPFRTRLADLDGAILSWAESHESPEDYSGKELSEMIGVLGWRNALVESAWGRTVRWDPSDCLIEGTCSGEASGGGTPPDREMTIPMPAPKGWGHDAVFSQNYWLGVELQRAKRAWQGLQQRGVVADGDEPASWISADSDVLPLLEDTCHFLAGNSLRSSTGEPSLLSLRAELAIYRLCGQLAYEGEPYFSVPLIESIETFLARFRRAGLPLSEEATGDRGVLWIEMPAEVEDASEDGSSSIATPRLHKEVSHASE
jgi:hypothetical protein